MRSTEARLVALEKVSPSVVHRPDGMGIDEFVALMLTSLTPEGYTNGEARKWLEAMTVAEVHELIQALDAIEKERAGRPDSNPIEGAPR